MPFSLAALIPGRTNRSRNPQRNLYFSPGGRTHDPRAIPPDRLHISLSDPVLVAAEERPVNVRNRRWNVFSTVNTPISFLLKGEILSQRSGDYDNNSLAAEAVDSLSNTSSFRGMAPDPFWQTGLHGMAPAHDLSPLDPTSDGSCDNGGGTITSVIDVSPGNASPIVPPIKDTGQRSSHLPPLASEALKEELYIKGYLKKPAIRPVVPPRRPTTTFMLLSRKVFPKVLGRRQGRNIAEILRNEQHAASESSAHPFREEFSTVALGGQHADTLEPSLDSPGMDTATSASVTFDLHEFSYITAFTTPPSSPSLILDAEMYRKGVDFGDSKHAV